MAEGLVIEVIDHDYTLIIPISIFFSVVFLFSAFFIFRRIMQMCMGNRYYPFVARQRVLEAIIAKVESGETMSYPIIIEKLLQEETERLKHDNWFSFSYLVPCYNVKRIFN